MNKLIRNRVMVGLLALLLLVSFTTSDMRAFAIEKDIPAAAEELAAQTEEEKAPVVQVAEAKEKTPALPAAAEEAKPNAPMGAAGDVEINDTNFPDKAFRDLLSDKSNDKNQDGVLSASEIAGITSLTLPRACADATGIRLLTSLQSLNCSWTAITELNVSGMQALTEVYYSDCPNLKVLDFRNCPNLVVGWHSEKGETVYISPGMTKYIGCDVISEHTGNLVIDLAGFYVKNQDGSKSVDLTKVISSTFISVFEAENHPSEIYDKSTKTLKIPAGEGKAVLQAGKQGDMKTPTHWTFYTDISDIPVGKECLVKFDTKGGSLVDAETIVKGSKVTKPADPTKKGMTFAGWYSDEAYTKAYDFDTPVNGDMTLYAKWEQIIYHKITASPNDEAYGTAEGSGDYAKGSEATLTATPKTGYHFVKWTENGTEVSSKASFKITVDKARTFVAVFEKNTCTATVTPDGKDFGTNKVGYDPVMPQEFLITSTGNSSLENLKVELTGINPDSFTLVKPVAARLDEKGGKADTTTFTVKPNDGLKEGLYTANIKVTADNMTDITKTVNFKVEAETGKQTIYKITASPNDEAYGTVIGSGDYVEGAEVKLAATPNTGYHFVKWTENGQPVKDAKAEYIFKAEKSRTLTAVFEKDVLVTITAEPNNPEYGEVTGSGDYVEGEEVTLVATPKADYHFVNWTENGKVLSEKAEYKYVFKAKLPRKLTAVFEKDTPAADNPTPPKATPVAAANTGDSSTPIIAAASLAALLAIAISGLLCVRRRKLQ